MKHLLIFLSFYVTISACSSNYRSVTETLPENASSSRYKDKHDSLPKKTIKAEDVQSLTVKAEPLSAGGNKDYEVWGKKYSVLASSKGYSQTGIASWYGAKFHNHKTANGETYDMYQLSAAHRSLPLPTYLKVTNLDNNKTVIVRVNDRGPFHESRLIDLSYAAAVKLDFINKGTARVKIEAIDAKATASEVKKQPVAKAEVKAPSIQSSEVAPVNTQYFLQLAAFKDKPAAQDYAQKVKVYKLLINERLIIESSDLHRVKVGPLNKTQAQRLKESLKDNYQIRAFLLIE